MQAVMENKQPALPGLKVNICTAQVGPTCCNEGPLREITVIVK